MRYFFAVLLIVYGMAVIYKPKWGDWGSLNDLVQKKVLGRKNYYIVVRYLSGPLLILLGIWILGFKFFPNSDFYTTLGGETPTGKTAEELNVSYGFEAETQWRMKHMADGPYRFFFVYPAYVLDEEGLMLSTRLIEDADQDALMIQACDPASDECWVATTIYYGIGFDQEEALVYLSSAYGSWLDLISSEPDQHSEMDRLYSNDSSLIVYHSEIGGFFFAYRREAGFSPLGDLEGDEGLWPYEVSFDYDDRAPSELPEDAVQ